MLGTFGRSFWILDDIGPLRELAATGAGKLMAEPLHLFEPPRAYVMNIGESFGYRAGKIGNVLFEGANRPQGAMISYYIKEVLKPAKPAGGEEVTDRGPMPDSIHFEIKDVSQRRMRWWVQKPKAGLNRTTWNLRSDGIRRPGAPKIPEDKPKPEGYLVPPGTYWLHISYGEHHDSTQLEVKADPRIDISQREINNKRAYVWGYWVQVRKVTKAVDQIDDAAKSIEWVQGKLKEMDGEAAKALAAQSKAMQDSLKQLRGMVFPPKKVQGIYRGKDLLIGQISETNFYLSDPLVTLTENHRRSTKKTKAAINEFLKAYNAFFGGALQEYKKAVAELNLPAFEEWETLDVNGE